MFVIMKAIRKWRQYLLGQPFKIFIDQISLNALMTQTIQTSQQQKWTAKFQGFQFEIFYKLGRVNMVVDACQNGSINLCLHPFLFDSFSKTHENFTRTIKKGKS